MSIFHQTIPEPYRIFGTRLLPFSLGRYRLLRRFDVSFVAEEETKSTIEDLLLGVFICGLKVSEFMDLLSDGEKFHVELNQWGKHVRKQIRGEKDFNVFAKIALFNRYVQDANYCPKFWDEIGDRPGTPTHWSHSIEIALRSQLGYTQEQIDEGPLAKALADYFQWAQAEGLIRILTDEEAELNEQMGESNLKALMGSIGAAAGEGEVPDEIKEILANGTIVMGGPNGS